MINGWPVTWSEAGLAGDQAAVLGRLRWLMEEVWEAVGEGVGTHPPKCILIEAGGGGGGCAGIGAMNRKQTQGENPCLGFWCKII